MSPQTVLLRTIKISQRRILTFLNIAIYCTRVCATKIYVQEHGGHHARLGENDHLFL